MVFGNLIIRDFSVEKRAKAVGKYIIESKNTIRKTAVYFGVSKSTIHKDIHRLRKIDNILFNKVYPVVMDNFNQKQYRGGHSTKLKYENKLH